MHLEDGVDKPIAFASRSLTEAEKGCAPIDKEGLAIVFGVAKFHQYLYGQSFTLLTDHRHLNTFLVSLTSYLDVRHHTSVGGLIVCEVILMTYSTELVKRMS